jgi:hypothetical protein
VLGFRLFVRPLRTSNAFRFSEVVSHLLMFGVVGARVLSGRSVREGRRAVLSGVKLGKVRRSRRPARLVSALRASPVVSGKPTAKRFDEVRPSVRGNALLVIYLARERERERDSRGWSAAGYGYLVTQSGFWPRQPWFCSTHTSVWQSERVSPACPCTKYAGNEHTRSAIDV